MRQITIDIPEGIEIPRFHLFQKVRAIVNGQNITGVILGVEFVDFRTALYHDAVPGWNYTVNLLYSVPEDEALQVAATKKDAHVVAQEKDLVAVGQPQNQ